VDDGEVFAGFVAAFKQEEGFVDVSVNLGVELQRRRVKAVSFRRPENDGRTGDCSDFTLKVRGAEVDGIVLGDAHIIVDRELAVGWCVTPGDRVFVELR